jgi:hypothetical protein
MSGLSFMSLGPSLGVWVPSPSVCFGAKVFFKSFFGGLDEWFGLARSFLSLKLLCLLLRERV